jgi:hypothetical protein
MAKILGSAILGSASRAQFGFLGVNGFRLARIAQLEHGCFSRLAWMSPLRAYIASSLLSALRLYTIVATLAKTNEGKTEIRATSVPD